MNMNLTNIIARNLQVMRALRHAEQPKPQLAYPKPITMDDLTDDERAALIEEAAYWARAAGA